jgi:hypothetical protein
MKHRPHAGVPFMLMSMTLSSSMAFRLSLGRTAVDVPDYGKRDASRDH